MENVNIGLSAEQRRGSVTILNKVLSNEMLLLIKTRKFHWDVVGPQFMTLHKLWDEQYEKISDFVDEVAERIRALGSYPVGTAKGFIEGAILEEHPGRVHSATESVVALVTDHESIIRDLRQGIDKVEEESRDKGTADFLTGIMEAHEEMAWMLRSFLEGEAVQADGKAPPAKGSVPHYA
jgi:starvation-inducible DNA-binding protein